jgi:hypothetical protein
VAMVAVQADDEAKTEKLRIVRRRQFGWLALAAVVALSAGGAYWAIYQRLPTVRENQALVRDLPVIEHVDEYLKVGDVDFLKQLERQNLFPAEVDDGT